MDVRMTAGTLLQCPLCGTRFRLDEAYGSGCQGCPLEALKGQCGYARCPHCGYDVMLEARPRGLVWLARLVGRGGTEEEKP